MYTNTRKCMYMSASANSAWLCNMVVRAVEERYGVESKPWLTFGWANRIQPAKVLQSSMLDMKACAVATPQ